MTHCRRRETLTRHGLAQQSSWTWHVPDDLIGPLRPTLERSWPHGWRSGRSPTGRARDLGAVDPTLYIGSVRGSLLSLRQPGDDSLAGLAGGRERPASRTLPPPWRPPGGADPPGASPVPEGPPVAGRVSRLVAACLPVAGADLVHEPERERPGAALRLPARDRPILPASCRQSAGSPSAGCSRDARPPCATAARAIGRLRRTASPPRPSLMSTSRLTAPISSPSGSRNGVGYGANGTRVPSGRSARASAPRTCRFCWIATAIGHWSWGSGVPSGQNSRQDPHHLVLPSSGRQPHRSAAARL